MSTLPRGPVARRLARDLAEIDRLRDLLARVNAGYRFTNRLDEAVLLVPEEVMAEIRWVLGTAPDNNPQENDE